MIFENEPDEVRKAKIGALLCERLRAETDILLMALENNNLTLAAIALGCMNKDVDPAGPAAQFIMQCMMEESGEESAIAMILNFGEDDMQVFYAEMNKRQPIRARLREEEGIE